MNLFQFLLFSYVLTFFCAAHASPSETYFRLIDRPNSINSSGAHILEDSAGNLVVGGYDYGKQNGKLFILKTDRFGTQIGQAGVIPERDSYDWLTSMVRSENTLLLASTLYVPNSRFTSYQRFPLLYQVSLQGWNEGAPTFDNLNPSGYTWNGRHQSGSIVGFLGNTTITPATNGDYFLTGGVYCCTHWYVNHRNYEHSAYIVRINARGKKTQEQILSYSNDERISFSSSIMTSNGDLVAVGNQEKIFHYDDPLVIRFNGNLQQRWAGRYVGFRSAFKGSVYARAADVIEADNGHLFILARMSMGLGPQGGGVIRSDQILLMKLNSNGDVVWQRTLAGRGSASASAMRAANDGSILVAGSTRRMAEGYTTGDSDILLAKFSKTDGSLIWSRYYGTQQNDGALGITISNSGHINVTGYADSYQTGGEKPTTHSKVLLLRTNSDGLIAGHAVRP